MMTGRGGLEADAALMGIANVDGWNPGNSTVKCHCPDRRPTREMRPF
jgi:hypothetical protein